VNDYGNDLITIRTFTYPHEMEVVRGHLESEGIECFVDDELTAQVNPFYSNAIGGVKLKIKVSDLLSAREILKESGYLEAEPNSANGIFNQFDLLSSKIPLVGQIRWEFRLLFIVALITIPAIIIVYLITLPTTLERLTQSIWCVNSISVNGREYKPKTYSMIKLVGAGVCDEAISFRESGGVYLPGFKSYRALGRWQLNKGGLRIFGTDTFSNVYDGVYQLDFINDQLILKSPKSTIYCTQQHLMSSF
jgi:hypothetical protein